MLLEKIATYISSHSNGEMRMRLKI